MENMNTLPYIESVKNQLLENLSNLRPAPAGEFVERPPDSADPEAAGKDEEDVEFSRGRGTKRRADGQTKDKKDKKDEKDERVQILD